VCASGKQVWFSNVHYVKNINVIERNGWKNPALLYNARTEFKWFINIYKHKILIVTWRSCNFRYDQTDADHYNYHKYFGCHYLCTLYDSNNSLLLASTSSVDLFFSTVILAYDCLVLTYMCIPHKVQRVTTHISEQSCVPSTRVITVVCVYPFHMLWHVVLVLRPEISVRDTVTVRITSSKRLKHASLVNARLIRK